MLVRIAAPAARARAIQSSVWSRCAWVGCGVAAQGVDDPESRPSSMRPGLVGDVGDVRQVGEAADAEAQRVDGAVVAPRTARSVIGPPAPVDGDRAVDLCRSQDRRVGRALGLDEGIAEAREQRVRRVAVGPDLQPLAHVEDDHAQVVDAVDVVGMGMGIDHARRARRRRRRGAASRRSGEVSISTVGRAVRPLPLDQQRAAAAAGSSGRPGRSRPSVRPAAARRRRSRSRGWSRVQPGHQAAASQAARLGEQPVEIGGGRARRSRPSSRPKTSAPTCAAVWAV